MNDPGSGPAPGALLGPPPESPGIHALEGHSQLFPAGAGGGQSPLLDAHAVHVQDDPLASDPAILELVGGPRTLWPWACRWGRGRVTRSFP